MVAAVEARRNVGAHANALINSIMAEQSRAYNRCINSDQKGHRVTLRRASAPLAFFSPSLASLSFRAERSPSSRSVYSSNCASVRGPTYLPERYLLVNLTRYLRAHYNTYITSLGDYKLLKKNTFSFLLITHFFHFSIFRFFSITK